MDDYEFFYVWLAVMCTAAFIFLTPVFIIPEVTHRAPYSAAHCLAPNGGYFTPCVKLNHFGET